MNALNFALSIYRLAFMHVYAGRSRAAPLLPLILICELLAENAIRPLALGRKNWMFSSSADGANGNTVVYTMDEMIKAHDLNIYGLLEHRQELAPWSEKLQSIKNRMWISVNYSNSQRTGVILYLTTLIFGAYDSILSTDLMCNLIHRNNLSLERYRLSSEILHDLTIYI